MSNIIFFNLTLTNHYFSSLFKEFHEKKSINIKKKYGSVANLISKTEKQKNVNGAAQNNHKSYYFHKYSFGHRLAID